MTMVLIIVRKNIKLKKNKMEAKEKAQELVNRFMFAGIYFTDGIDGARKNAKQCALIAVDEIQNTKAVYANDVEYDYWEQVKHELIKSE